MPDDNKSFLSKFSIKNPLARIVYSSAPIASAFFIELSKHLSNADEQKILISTLTTAGIIAAPIAGVAANVLAEAISHKFFNRFSRKDILENGDLQKAVGDAICATILAIYDEEQSIFKQKQSRVFQKLKGYFQKEIYLEAKGISLNKDVLKQLSKVPTETWQKLVEELEKDKDDEFNFTIEEIEALYPKNLPDIFAIPAAKFNEVTVLDKNVWEKVLRKLCRLQEIETSNEKYPHFTDTIAHIAEVLVQNFPELLKHTLVSNITKDGKAYANLQLKIMGEVLFYVRENNEKLNAANDKLFDIEAKICDLRELLENGLSPDSAEFDKEFVEIKDSIFESQQIIVEAIGKLEIKIDIVIEGQEELKKGQEKAQESLDNIGEKLDFVEIKPKEAFKGFHKSFPRVPDFFTGRIEVLEQLEKTLEKENQASFYGTHGLGKTRTAIEYALTHRKDYEFVLFISATKGNFVNNAAFVGAEISEAINNAPTLEGKYDLFIKYLQNRQNWLIIIDNVENVWKFCQ